MRFGPPVSFTRNRDGAALAYQVVGEGELDLVFLLGWATHLPLMWENPAFARFLERLASFSRLILFDHLGQGLSDRGGLPHTFEDGMDDIRAVMSAVGSERAALFGFHLGGRLALMFAATYPDQTSAVVTYGAHPATLRDADYPWGSTEEQRDEVIAGLRDLTLQHETLLSLLAPSEADDVFMRRWFTTFYQSAVSRAESVNYIESLGPVDIRGLLGAVRAPTLVLHRTGDRIAEIGASRYMAQRLPNATFKELPGDDHLPFVGDQEAILALAQEFLTGTMPEADVDRVLATVLFTDIVNSTRLATQLGDRRWHRLLAEHDAVVRTQLARFRGKEDKTTGDGFLASFDGPARAIKAADAIRAGLAEHGLQVRVGLHTGECEFLGGGIGGIAVHIAARILAQAQAGEILCSRTVKDLVAGAGFNFTDRGVHRLKGVQDDWQLYAVQVVGRQS